MIQFLEYSDILNLPKEIIRQANDHPEYDSILSERARNKNYNYKEIRADIKSCIEQFKDTKYIYATLTNYHPKSSSTHSLNDWVKLSKKDDPFSKIVDKRTDDLIWAREFYHYMYDVAKQLTLAEAIYFVDDFFDGKTEDIIAGELGMSKTTLTKVKRSCLLKVNECLEFFIRNTY